MNLEARDIYDKMHQHIADILLLTDINGIVVYHNVIAESFFHYTPLKGVAVNDFFNLKDSSGKKTECPVLRCFQENKVIESTEPLLNINNNRFVTFKASPIHLDNKTTGCLITIQDVDYIKKIKFQTNTDQSLLSSLFENAPLGLAVIDIEGNILEVNQAMLTILGSPSAEATKQINILKFPNLLETPLPKIFHNVIETKKSASDIAKYTTKWGKLIYVNFQLVPIVHNLEVQQLLLYVNDLTSIYNAQEKEMLIKNQISLLNQFSYESITLDSQFDPFVFIGEKVKTLLPTCTIAINKYHPSKNIFTNEYLYSPKKPIQELSQNISDQKLTVSYTLPTELWPINFQGKFINIPYDKFLTVNFSIRQEEIISLILKSNVEKIYSMGFINNSMLLGNITIFTHQEEKNIEFIEVLINQASLLLQRHLSQKKIRKNHAFYKSILNTIDDYILVIDKNYKIVFANQLLLKFLTNQHLQTSILGLEIQEAIPFLNHKIYEHLTTCKTNKQNQLYQSTTVINNTLIYCQTSISYLSIEQDEEQFIIAIRDVTKLVLKSKEVETLTKINEKIIENLNEGLLLLDSNHKVKLANESFIHFFEINRDRIIDTNVVELIPTNIQEKAVEILKNLSQKPVNLYFEIPFQNSKGVKKIFSKEIYPIIENNVLSFILVLVKDITDQKNRELSLIESKEKAELRNNLKSTFIATISHEIRNSINAIHGFAHLLQKTDLTTEKRETYVKQIYANSTILSRIIDDLIDYTKFETGNLQLINETIFIYDLLKELHEQYLQELIIRNKQHINLKLENSPDENIPFETDKLRLKQILSNLLINAIKYTYSGEIVFGYKTFNNSIVFYVKDTGTGIKEEHIPKLYKPFVQFNKNYTTEQKGAGLGLTIIKTLTELMNGTIHVESKWQVGSTFTISFPYYKPISITKNPSENKNKSTVSHPLTILIAEDDDINYLFLEEMLSDYHFTLIHAKNGKEAVELFKTNIDKINLVLMDIQMPIMDGFTATKKIKELKPDILVIAQTAYAYSTEIELSKKAGCSDYLVKPIQLELLLEKITQYTQ